MSVSSLLIFILSCFSVNTLDIVAFFLSLQSLPVLILVYLNFTDNILRDMNPD